MAHLKHSIPENNSIFKVHQCNDESFLYAILAVLYSNSTDRILFHHIRSYEKYRKTLNLSNILFPITNKDIPYFLSLNHSLTFVFVYLTL